MFNVLDTFKKIKVGFYISISVLLISSIVSFVICQSLLKKMWWVNHSNEIVTQLQSISSVLRETESDIRGYAITRDSIFLIPSIEDQSEKAHKLIDGLRKSIDDNDLQLQNLEQLNLRVRDRFILWDSILKQPDYIQNKSYFVKGKKVITDIDYLLAEMIYNEKKLLIDRNRRFANVSDIFIPIILVTSLIGIGISILAYYALQNEIRTKREAFNQLSILSEELEENVQSLNKSNKELEQFAYVASHDLQEPLRKIVSFSDRLATKNANELSEETKNYLGIIVKAATRMRALIDDLLSFSRLSQKTALEKVNLNQVVKEVVKDLDHQIQAKKAKLHISELPSIQCVRFQIYQLFQNLISNSLKYAQNHTPPQIDISCEIISSSEITDIPNVVNSDYCQIRITDNGIGFEQQYADRIFMIFQRLHGKNEYDGTGIGLAICKKIVENHLGSLKAKSAPDEGATFIISLPLNMLNDD